MPHVSVCADGSVLIEWIGEHRRVVLCLEKDPKESSWHFVSKSKEDGVACELLSEINVEHFANALRWVGVLE